MKKNGKRCGMCDNWLQQCLKEKTFCDACLALVKKHKELWRKTKHE